MSPVNITLDLWTVFVYLVHQSQIVCAHVTHIPFGREACHIARRRRVFIRPKVERSMLAVGEVFVWARSAVVRRASVIARRRLALPPRGTKTSTPTAASTKIIKSVTNMMMSTTDSAILHFNFVGVFHRDAEGEPIKIRHM